MLCDLNQHTFDTLTSFDEASHTYTYLPSGKKFPKSVTYLVKAAFASDFNAKEVIESNLSKWASNPDSKYYVLIRHLSLVRGLNFKEIEQEIKALWSAEGEEARNLGTGMHAELENWMNGIEATDASKHAYAVAIVSNALKQTFFTSMDLKPYRTEFRVFLTADVVHPQAPGVVNTIPVLSGTIDALFKDKIGRLWIIDWKRTDPSKKGLLGVGGVPKFAKHGIGKFNQFFESDFTKYSLQLVIYKLMLERGGYLEPGQSIAGLFLCQVHPSMTAPHFIEALSNLTSEAQEAFEEAANALLEDHIQACKAKELSRLQAAMDADTEDDDDDGESNPNPNSTVAQGEGGVENGGMCID